METTVQDGLTTAEGALAAPAAQAETNASVARATGILSLGSIASRVLGMARDVVLTNLFGASAATDAFFVATLVPRTLYDLLIGGHVNGAIIPVLSEVVTREGKAALWQLVSALVSLLAVIMAAGVLVLMLLAPQVVDLVGGGYTPRTQALAVDLLRITAPAMLFLSLFAVLSGTLYALRSFTYPALAGAIFNACVVVGTIVLAPAQQIFVAVTPTKVHWLIDRPAEGIRSAAIGWLFGAVVQLALQIPGLRAQGARLRFSTAWRHPAVRQIGLLYVPVMFSLALDALVRVFSYNLASSTGESSLSYMNWATTLIQFPQGLVATAISIAILPTLSRQAVLATEEGGRAFRDTLGLGLRLAITLMIPAAIGLFVAAVPIIDLLFEHGAFMAVDTEVTALALRLYLFGLPFAAIDLLLVYAFYARQDTLTPALIGLFSLILYMVVALALAPALGVFSLMVADSAKHIIHALLSGYLLARRTGGLGEQRIISTTAKATLAALLMAGAALLVMQAVPLVIDTERIVGEVGLVVAVGAVSGLAYAAAALALRLEVLTWIARLVWARLRG